MGLIFVSRKSPRNRRALNSPEQGTILVEVLVAALILLLVFTAVIHEITNLSVLRVQLETRDRAVAYASSLHEQLKAAGCGFDVDYVAPVIDPENPTQELNAFRGPWGRVQGCALAAQANAFEQGRNVAGTDRGLHFWIDGNNFVRLTQDLTGDRSNDDNITLSTAVRFCNEFGDLQVGSIAEKFCNLGDQTFEYSVPTIGDNSPIVFDVRVNYWFEKVGVTSRSTSCSTINGLNSAPDVIARRITVEWEERGNPRQSLTITKRDNVPVDSVEFALGNRVGLTYNGGDSAALILSEDNSSIDGDYPFALKRDLVGANGTTPAGCVWFPFLNSAIEGRANVFVTSIDDLAGFDSDSEGRINQPQNQDISGLAALTNRGVL